MCNDATLLSKTKELLDKYGGTYLEIYSATGIRPSWVSALATGKIQDPSVNKVQRLYEFLRGTPLTV